MNLESQKGKIDHGEVRKQKQFFSWLTGESDYFPFFQNPEEHKVKMPNLNKHEN